MNSDAIREEISRRTLLLNNHRKNADFLISLQGSDAKAKVEAAALDRLTADLDKALAKETKEAKAALASRFRNLTIVVASDDFEGGSVLRSGFRIHYEELAYNVEAKGNTWQARHCDGFLAMSNELYAYMMEHQPDAIPARVLALAATPSEAMAKLFAGYRRGHLNG